MKRGLMRRLMSVEMVEPSGTEIWIDQGDGTVRSLDGKQIMMREEAEALAQAAGAIPIIFLEGDTQL